MGLFNNRNKPKKLNTRVILTFKEAMKYAQDENYAQYEFMPVDENDFEKGFRIQSKEAVRENIDRIKRRKFNTDFEQTVIAGEIYKGIDSEISKNNKPKYNNYQNSKGYEIA